MKLLSVIVTMDPKSGGPAQGIRNNIPFWIRQGVVPSILSFDKPGVDFVAKENIITVGPVKNRWAYAPKAIDWLLINLCNYDVVLIHGLWQYHGFAVNKAIRTLNAAGKKIPKVFVMPHGMLDPYFQKAPERRLKAIRNIVYWHLIEKHVINNADGILFTCLEELQLANTTFSGYLPKADYNVGYGIIQPPAFSDIQIAAFYEKCPAVINKPYILFLSRIHQKKGVDILLKAYAQCHDYCQLKGLELPDLVIAGPGMDTDYGQSLKVVMAEYPILLKKVHYPGMLQGDAKWGALYGAELFVLPSHQENFGIAIVEAMACKTPVLITNKVNIWREIATGKGGIVVEDTMADLLTALKQWVHLDASEKEIIGKNAFDSFNTYFTAEATSKNFVEVLQNTLNK